MNIEAKQCGRGKKGSKLMLRRTSEGDGTGNGTPRDDGTPKALPSPPAPQRYASSQSGDSSDGKDGHSHVSLSRTEKETWDECHREGGAHDIPLTSPTDAVNAASADTEGARATGPEPPFADLGAPVRAKTFTLFSRDDLFKAILEGDGLCERHGDLVWYEGEDFEYCAFCNRAIKDAGQGRVGIRLGKKVYFHEGCGEGGRPMSEAA